MFDIRDATTDWRKKIKSVIQSCQIMQFFEENVFQIKIKK